VRAAYLAEPSSATEINRFLATWDASVNEAAYAADDYGVFETLNLPSGLMPVVTGYATSTMGGVLRTEVAGGPMRYGIDYAQGAIRFDVTLVLNAEQFSVWSAFHARIIKKGALRFNMPLDSGFGVEPHACNIVPGSYSTTRTGGIAVVVSFAVDAENKAYEFTTLEAQNMIAAYESAMVTT